MKYALVTGSTTGIGLAVTRELFNNGFFVYMHYFHDISAEDDEIIAPDKRRLVKADLSTPEGAGILTDEIVKEDIKLDAVVLNAGVSCRKPFGQVSYDDWNEVMNVNVNSSFQLCQQLYPHITDSGSITFIGSDMGIYPHAISHVYSVSKAASHMLAQSLVKEFSEQGIRVNVIAPGFIDTDWQNEKPQWLREKIEEKIALKRFGTPNEVADACMFLVNNSYMNGAILQIDGGYCYM